MRIFAIGDLHMSLSVPDKSMGIFGEQWVGHWEKIESSWSAKVGEQDVVLIPGDISWAMHLCDAVGDLAAIDRLPGTKIFLKGNHDYWWQSISKIKAVVSPRMLFLQNNCFAFPEVAICGTRGWNVPGSKEFSEQDQKIFNREVERLKLSLESHQGEQEILVMMHYPPYNDRVEHNDMVQALQDHQIKRVLFGHIHGMGLKFLKEGEHFGIDFRCVSCDYLNFEVKQIL